MTAAGDRRRSSTARTSSRCGPSAARRFGCASSRTDEVDLGRELEVAVKKITSDLMMDVRQARQLVDALADRGLLRRAAAAVRVNATHGMQPEDFAEFRATRHLETRCPDRGAGDGETRDLLVDKGTTVEGEQRPSCSPTSRTSSTPTHGRMAQRAGAAGGGGEAEEHRVQVRGGQPAGSRRPTSAAPGPSSASGWSPGRRRGHRPGPQRDEAGR